MTKLVLAALLLALAGCASRPERRDDAPLPVRTVALPPEVAGNDPHRPGGPFDLKPGSTYDERPDAGARPELPGYMESPPPGASGQGASPWRL